MATSWDRYTRLFGTSPRPESATDLSLGSVVLREAKEQGAAERPEAPFALHLVLDPGAEDQFTLEGTHGVRFRLS
jgi:hypothetical protein